MNKKNTQLRVLIIYFSLSGQSRGLINLLAAGIRNQNIFVTIEQIQPRKKIGFPLGTLWRTVKMMFSTFFRARIPIQKLSSQCYENYQLIILAGPTWSYNPSGPILSLLDSEGKALFKDQRVLPLISCRGYHRLHNVLLRIQLKRYGARLEESLIFAHPISEPWSTIGVFLKSAGYRPEQISLLKSHYSHFGHTTDQLQQVKRYGNLIGKALLKNESIDLKSSSAQKLVPGYHR